MPLKKSASKAAFGDNIKAEIASGKSQKQSVAIAYGVKKKAQGHHSPARDVVGYDETFLGNASVPQVGLATANPGTYSNPSGGGPPKAVSQTDGTANLGDTATTKMAAANSTPSGGKSQYPNVQHYSGEDT